MRDRRLDLWPRCDLSTAACWPWCWSGAGLVVRLVRLLVVMRVVMLVVTLVVTLVMLLVGNTSLSGASWWTAAGGGGSGAPATGVSVFGRVSATGGAAEDHDARRRSAA